MERVEEGLLRLPLRTGRPTLMEGLMPAAPMLMLIRGPSRCPFLKVTFHLLTPSNAGKCGSLPTRLARGLQGVILQRSKVLLGCGWLSEWRT